MVANIWPVFLSRLSRETVPRKTIFLTGNGRSVFADGQDIDDGGGLLVRGCGYVQLLLVG